MGSSIDGVILQKKKKISQKQKEIKDLRQDILSLEILRQEMHISEPTFQEEYFIVPKRIVESYFESILQ